MKRVLQGLLVVLLVALVVLFLAVRSETTGSNELVVTSDEVATAEAERDPDFQDDQSNTSGSGDTSASGDVDDADDVDTPRPVEGQPLAPATAREATVRRLADGDSFDIEWSDTGERDEVRLYGVNAPESGTCFGDEAREILEILVGEDPVLVDGVERDEFGRVLADVWVGDLFINASLVELGAALQISGDGSHAGLIEEAQTFAERSNAGLWDPEACGADPAGTVAIADIRADAPGRDDENPNGEWIEIVNDGQATVELTGWSIRDESTRHRFNFPDGFTLDAGSSVRVFSGCGDDRADEVYWCDGDPVWNNGGDTGFLVDPDGRFADTYSY